MFSLVTLRRYECFYACHKLLRKCKNSSEKKIVLSLSSGE